jgi:hypothetical protein
MTLRSQPHNTTGFIAVDDVKQLIVVSFRGSEPLRSRVPDSNTNLDSLNAQVSASVYCTDCAAAKGYYESFMEVNKTVIEAVQAQRQLHADYQVVTTGHSLGGSLSMFAALELRRLGVNVHAVSTSSHTHNTPKDFKLTLSLLHVTRLVTACHEAPTHSLHNT